MKSELMLALEGNCSGVIEGHFSTNLSFEEIVKFVKTTKKKEGVLNLKLSNNLTSLGEMSTNIIDIFALNRTTKYKNESNLFCFTNNEEIKFYLYFHEDSNNVKFGKFLATI